MVTLPKEFVMTRFPGYFWNTNNHKLYSIKVTGELRPLTFNKGGTFYGVTHMPGYQISVNGQKRRLTLDYLKTLKLTTKKEEIKVNDERV